MQYLTTFLSLLQRVLLHPNGEARPASAERRREEPRRARGCARLRAGEGAQPALQPQQPPGGERSIYDYFFLFIHYFLPFFSIIIIF